MAAARNLYISDVGNQRVRKLTPVGTISTFAGGGQPGRGDGGAATMAQISAGPLAVDSAGNVYIGELSRVRKVTPSGTISTVAGGGSAVPSEDAMATGVSFTPIYPGLYVTVDRNGILYISGKDRVWKIGADGILHAFAGNGQYKFGGDGGPATSAALDLPYWATVDGAGNLYISDYGNNRVRKVNAAGIINTIAGNGQYRQSTDPTGDGGPATQAHLTPMGIAVDSSGNVFFVDNDRVRKVTPTGIISTVLVIANNYPGFAGLAVDSARNLYVADLGKNQILKVTPAGSAAAIAGTGVAGYSGDAGPGTSAMLNQPLGVAVDSSGNVYFCDQKNFRIRKVSASGVITTVAGTGQGGFSGAGGPATSASFGACVGVAADSAGSFYFSDSSSSQVEKVTADGIIHRFAGGDRYGDGWPAVSATLYRPYGLALDTVGNLYITQVGAGVGGGNVLVWPDLVRKVLAATPTFAVAPLTLSFNAASDAPTPSPQKVGLSSTLGGSGFSLGWNALLSTSDGGNWLKVSTSTGLTPASIMVSVDAATLTPGTYTGTVAIYGPGGTPGQQNVSVTFTVMTPNPPALSVQPAALTFQGTASGTAPRSQTIQISNVGGGTLNWTAAAQTSTSANWLSVSAASGSATPSTPSSLVVQVNIATLAPGSYNGTVTVSGGGSAVTVPVYLTLNAPQQTLLVSQTGLSFIGLAGGGVIPSQQFGVLNTGTGAMAWTVKVATPNCAWLSVSPGSGSSTGGSLNPPLVDVQATSAGLSAGQYSCQISVNAPGATNAVRLVTVIQNVLPAGSVLPPVIRPTGLIFVRQAGATSPGSQTTALATAAPSGVHVHTGASTFDGATWLSTLQQDFDLIPGQSGTVTVQPDISVLPKPGQYFGTVDLKFLDVASQSFTPQSVAVLFVVTPSSSQTVDAQGLGAPAAGGVCAPSQLYMKSTTLGTSFSTAVGYPAPIEVQVKDDCDNPISNATAIATFSSGEPPLSLVHIGNGAYHGSWRPNSAATVTISLSALAPGLKAAKDTVTVNSNGSQSSTIYAGGIVPGASFLKGAGLAPGGIVAIFGTKMGTDALGAASVPLPTSLAGASVSLGGFDAPIYFSSDGQINAQLPFEVPAGSAQAYLRLNRGGQTIFTDSEPVTVIPAAPGIFTTNSSGTGQGAILIANSTLLAAPVGTVPGVSSQPVPRGQYITIFCSGLGPVSNQPPTGAKTPDSPLSNALTAPTVMIGAQTSTVGFAGLAPGFVGLYQVNALVPSDATPGDAVPVTVSQNGVASNTVTIAIR